MAPRGGSEPRVPSPQEIGTRLLRSEDPLEVELIGSMFVAGLFTTAPVDEALIEDFVSLTLHAIDRFEPEFTRALKSSSAGGPSKNLLLAMQRDGVDLRDREKVSAWIEEFNQRPLEERDRVLRGED